MPEIAYEVVFKTRGGSHVITLQRRVNPENDKVYRLKNLRRKWGVEFGEHLPKRIIEALPGFDFSEDETPLSVEWGEKKITNLPLIELFPDANQLYKVRKDENGVVSIEIPIDRKKAIELENVIQEKEAGKGLSAFFKQLRGEEFGKPSKKAIEKYSTEIRRAILLTLHSKRTGVSRRKTMRDQDMGRFIPKNSEIKALIGLSKMESEHIPKLLELVNNDEIMVQLRKKHGIEEFTENEIDDIVKKIKEEWGSDEEV